MNHKDTKDTKRPCRGSPLWLPWAATGGAEGTPGRDLDGARFRAVQRPGRIRPYMPVSVFSVLSVVRKN
jgi:hypothetical protein